MVLANSNAVGTMKSALGQMLISALATCSHKQNNHADV